MSEDLGTTLPKASIGNYKGVMLCNRPNELGQKKVADSGLPMPFMSGGSNANLNPLGWNPCQKILPKSRKKLGSYYAVLKRHRAYLAQLAE